MKKDHKSKLSEAFSDPKRFKKSRGIVKDSITGLDWLPSSDKYMTYQEAVEYCEKLGARLPTVQELFSLVDYSKREPAINTNIFPDTKSSYYWTSTEYKGYSWRWVVGFRDGFVGNDDEGGVNYVRPVRASQ